MDIINDSLNAKSLNTSQLNENDIDHLFRTNIKMKQQMAQHIATINELKGKLKTALRTLKEVSSLIEKKVK